MIIKMWFLIVFWNLEFLFYGKVKCWLIGLVGCVLNYCGGGCGIKILVGLIFRVFKLNFCENK